jgi:ComF family protein
VRTLVHALKYEQAEYAVRDLSLLAEHSPGYFEHLRGAILVPVPLHRRKLRERGYNQSELIARRLSAIGGPSIRVENLLERVVDTPSQTHYSRKDRQTNLKNAFALTRNAVIMPDNRYVLLDDVFTTGSTLNACAKVLRRSGVKDLDIATIGHG